MKTLVVYDSAYGNTQRVAEAIAGALSPDATLVPASQAEPDALKGADLVVFGSPTQGGRPTSSIQQLLGAIPAGQLEGVSVAAFDTRIAASERGLPLRLLMRLIGYAAPRIAVALKAKGGHEVSGPEGFIVEGKEGPLREGETQRAAAWAGQVRVAAR